MTLSVLLSLVGFLLTIGIVVMIHEGGHYLAAKWLGFGVKRFSIGMGRVLWRRRAGYGVCRVAAADRRVCGL